MPSSPAERHYPNYAGQCIAPLTQQGKVRMNAPVLDAALSCRIERIGGYDTDQLGTLTRELPRPGSQMDAVRTKARFGMAQSSLPEGIANEGAFGPDPMVGMLAWSIEGAEPTSPAHCRVCNP